MLGKETGIGAAALVVVLALAAMDVLPVALCHQFAISRTQNMFVAQVGTHSRLA